MQFCGNPLNRLSHKRKTLRLSYLENERCLYLKNLKFLQKDNFVIFKPRQIFNNDVQVYLGRDEAGLDYWAMDVSKSNTSALEEQGKWFEMRPHAFKLPKFEASILGLAVSIIDWIERYKHCPNCGSQVEIAEAGYKLICSQNCNAEKSVQNYMHPRTDPAIICLVVSADNSKCLLGRSARFPVGMYSCIAGFMEPGENIEEACAREVKEETGICITDVKYLFSQPWPFPSQLMIGCIAKATSDEIALVDQELEDALWFSRDEVVKATQKQGSLVLPGEHAIATSLVHTWINNKSKF